MTDNTSNRIQENFDAAIMTYCDFNTIVPPTVYDATAEMWVAKAVPFNLCSGIHSQCGTVSYTVQNVPTVSGLSRTISTASQRITFTANTQANASSDQVYPYRVSCSFTFLGVLRNNYSAFANLTVLDPCSNQPTTIIPNTIANIS
jgi:hypothetical protein